MNLIAVLFNRPQTSLSVAPAPQTTETARSPRAEQLPDLDTSFNPRQDPVTTQLPPGSLMAAFSALREEIARHKWIESEKVGHDIGFDSALCDWMKNHRAGWRREFMEKLNPKKPG